MPTGSKTAVAQKRAKASAGSRPSTVVAASYGAYVGLLLAARHPELVGSVLAATVTDVAKAGDAGLGEPGARLAAAVVAAARGGDRTEVYDAIVHRRAPLHDGKWAMATLEVCLAILQSAREQREITLAHQVATRS